MTSVAPTSARFQAIDLLRGIAIGLMVAFHFSYDLSHFGFAAFDFHNDPFWLHARTLILSLFLLLVGISLTLATRTGVRWRAFLRRLAVIAACAALISLSSYLMFAQRWIFFGVLHFIALASLIGLAFVRRPWLALILGSALVGLDTLYSHAFFDQALLQWVGLMTHKPPTEDYVPLVPWFGVVLIGIFAGHQFIRSAPNGRWRSDNPAARLLSYAGRHSLLIYMLHQPLLLGLLWTIKSLIGP